MKKGIARWLQIDTGNRNMILSLLVQAGCTGMFAGTLELAAHALFLSSYGAKDIPLAIMVSGAAGILLASVYSYFSKQLEIRPFGILNLAAVVALTAALLLGTLFLGTRTFDFVLFVLMGPMLLLTLMGFWVTVRGFLSPSRSRELAGLIEAALVGGMVLAFAGVPLLVSGGLSLRGALFIGMGSLIAATVAQLQVLAGMRRSPVHPVRRTSSTGPIRLFSHRYTGLISAFAVTGVAVSLVLHYSFLWTASDRYPGSSELVLFLGFFFALAVASGWLMKRFVFDRIKRRRGLGFTLLFTPVMLLLLSLSAVVAGDLYGFRAEAGMITAFSLLVILTRFLSGVWNRSVEGPSLEVIYQTLDPREKQNVKSGIEGVLNQIAVFGIGLFLACLVLLNFIEVVHLVYVLILLTMAWFFIGLSLYRQYHRILRISLDSDRIRDRAESSLEELAASELDRTAFPVETMEFNPFYFHYQSVQLLLDHLKHPDSSVRRRIWDHLLQTSPGLSQLVLSQWLSREDDPAVKDRIRLLSKRKLRSRLGLQAAFIRERLDRFSGQPSQWDPAIGEAFHSGERNEVFAALYHVAREHDPTFLPEVIQLLKAPDLELRSVAISTAGHLDSRRVTGTLIENLGDPHLCRVAWSALVRQGDSALEELDAAFYKPGTDTQLQKRIVSVLAAIGGPRALMLVLDKLDYHHRDVFSEVVRGLYENQFQASALQVSSLQSAILRLVQTGAWNLAARISLRTENPGGEIDRALRDEIWEVNGLILKLLSMIYDRRSVNRIRIYISDRQSDDRGMAIEMLDLLLKKPLKSVLTAYFSDVLVREKIDRLQQHYRLDLIPVSLLLRRILNRDGMQLGDFIRICVLERMGSDPGFFDEQQIIAQGFHPNPKIRETAAQILRKNDPGRYDMVTERLDFPDNAFTGHEDPARWFSETTIKLAAWKLFKNVGLNSLFRLVSLVQPLPGDGEIPEGGVLLARAENTGQWTPFSTGMALLVDQHPELLDQIRYLGAEGNLEAYLVDKEDFIGLMFDDRSLLHVFCAFLNQPEERQV